MISTLAAALLIMPGASCCHDAEHWREQLPLEAKIAVNRVDQTAQPTQEEKALAQHRKEVASDVELGKKYSEEIEKELKLSENVAATERLQRIGAEMAAIANANNVTVLWGDSRLSEFQYSFKLVKGDDVNAFSIPGGFIYFYEGLLEFTESDDELAAVIGHEISHASFRHLATMRRQASRFDWVQLPLLIIAALSRSPDAVNALQAGSLAMQGISSGWSVQAEVAADFGGIQYMQKSRYNPVGALTFMERLQYRDRFMPKINWGIYQTHPLSDERAKFIGQKLNELQIPIRRSQTTTSLAASAIPQDDGSVLVNFGKTKIFTFRGPDAGQRALEAVVKLNEFFDSVPDMFEIGMESRRLTGRGRTLFRVEPEDAEPFEGNIELAVQEAATNMRKAVFDLAYRMWQAPIQRN